jgi:hypothetical protein
LFHTLIDMAEEGREIKPSILELLVPVAGFELFRQRSLMNQTRRLQTADEEHSGINKLIAAHSAILITAIYAAKPVYNAISSYF